MKVAAQAVEALVAQALLEAVVQAPGAVAQAQEVVHLVVEAQAAQAKVPVAQVKVPVAAQARAAHRAA